MKTNVSIKFNSIKEYREIESKLIEIGYHNNKEWNESELKTFQKGYVCIDNKPTDGRDVVSFDIFDYLFPDMDEVVYNTLEDFLNDN